MVFTNDTISIDSTTRRSVYKTTYNLTSPNTKYAYINLRFHSEYKLVTKRRGPSKIKILSEGEPSSDYASLLAENEALRKEVERLKKQNNAE